MLTDAKIVERPALRVSFLKKASVVVLILLLLLVARIIQYGPQYRADNARRAIAITQYSHLKATCFDVTNNPIFSTYVGVPRSQERFNALNKILFSLVKAKCLKVSETDIARNPYEGIDLTTLNAATIGTAAWNLDQGALFYLDHGFSMFSPDGGTVCTDGWVSASRGPGTCSWHGGYAHARGSPLMFFSVKVIPDPQYQ